MTGEQWAPIEQLLANGWGSPRWTQAAASTYRAVLAGRDPEQVTLAIFRLIERGGPYRPSIAEVVASINVDAGVPMWSEAYTAIIGICWDPRRLDGVHEVVRLFVQAKGLNRLQTLPLNDPNWGHVEQKRLGDEYAQFVERYQERQREGRALEALGRSTRGELAKPDYLAALSDEPGADGQAAATSRLPEETGEPARTASAGRLRRRDPLAAPDGAPSPSPPTSSPQQREPNSEGRR
jgi:hypothetical protein